ncbi:MAG: hypothetical protein WA990_12335 [Rubrobacteraceae bacterium]
MNGETGSRNTRRLLIVGALALLFIVSFVLTLVLLGGEEETAVSQRTPTTQGASATQESSTKEMSTTRETSSAETASTTQGTTYSIPSSGGGMQMSESRIFESLGQMVATSELVATGTVTEVLPGRVIRDEALGPDEDYMEPMGKEGEVPPPPPEEVAEAGAFPTRFPQTMVRIDKVLKGGAPAKDVIPVETLELAYARPNLEWREPGKRVLLFAVRGRSPGVSKPLYFPVNRSQSVYVLRDKDLVATVSDPMIPLEERIASLSLPQLRAEVEQAKVRISRGEVEALEPRGAGPNQ